MGAAHAAYAALRPVLTDPGLAATVDARFTAVTAVLAPYRRGDGYVDYTTVTAAERRRIAEALDALAEPLSHMAAAIPT